MSYDIYIYLEENNEEKIEEILYENFYQQTGNEFLFETDNFVIHFSEILSIEEEDIPPDIFNSYPGLKYSIEINIEGKITKKTIKAVQRLSKKIVKTCKGYILDSQNEVANQKPIKYKLKPDKENNESLHLYFYFENENFDFDKKNISLINIVKKYLPEALPRRYGRYEPPQYKIERNGESHFINFLKESDYDIVWYPYKPVKWYFMSIPNDDKNNQIENNRFRCATIDIEISLSVLEFEGWYNKIVRFWFEASVLLNTFFSEIRIGESPNMSWWFKGIPRKLGIGALVNEKYSSFWPNITESINCEERFKYCLIPFDKRKDQSVDQLIGNPPEKISHVERKIGFFKRLFSKKKNPLLNGAFIDDIEYPKIFPFDLNYGFIQFDNRRK